MPYWEIIILICALLIMLLGLLGSLLPVVPGLPIIWFTALFYGWITNFREIDENYLTIFGILTAAILLLDYVASIYGAKKLGASRWGMVGAFLGMIIGLIVGTLPGFIIGPLIGAVTFELLIGKKFGTALKAGFGTFLGFLAGVVFKVILSAVMISVFVWLVLF